MAELIMMPGGRYGTRAIVEVASAVDNGDRLRATLKGWAAADRLVVGPSGDGHDGCSPDYRDRRRASLYGVYSGRVNIE